MSDASSAVTEPATGWAARLNERLGLDGLRYPVPAHASSLPYVLGGITFVGFLILFATGIYLAQFYHPDPGVAHDTVVYTVERAWLGDFIRSIHFWTASVVTITALLHLIRIFKTGSYKRPREVNWWVGLGLLGLALGFTFTGSVLKWDQEGYEALLHNREAAELLGALGYWFSTEFTRSVPLLTRLYIGHISILPALFTGLILAHFFLIKQHGISHRPAEVDAAGGTHRRPQLDRSSAEPFTLHLRRMIGWGLLLLGLVSVLAILSPAPLGFAPIAGEEVTKPPWMFLWLYPVEDVLGIGGLFWGAVVTFLILALVPLVDRSPWRSAGRRRGVVVAYGLLLLAAAALAVIALLTRPVPHVMG